MDDSPTSPSPIASSPCSRRLRCVALSVALALCAVAGAVAPATAHSASATMFNFTGRGWGHGIGMSQYGAYGYATHTTLSYKAILKHYYTGISFGTVANDPIRVMLNQGLTSVGVTSTSRFTATDGTSSRRIGGGLTAKVTWTGSKYRVAWGSASFDFAAPVVFKPGGAHLKLVNATQLGYSGVLFRGQLRVIHLTAGFTVVNRVPLESYLYGVVPRESPASWPLTALKVQAVAARSYAMATRKSGGLFDVYCTAWSQVYNGVGVGLVGESDRSTEAVNDTKGVVGTYAGKVITAYFFSTSGGHTENIENVWTSAAPVPYLKGVTDPYDDASPYHIWKPFTKTGAEVASALGIYTTSNPSGVDGILRTICVVKRGTSPRVIQAYVVGDGGSHLISGSTLRVRLGLRDTWVYIRTLSVSPSQSTKKTITFGESARLTGRTYPALASGAKVTLHYYRDGSWRTLNVATARGATPLPNGGTAAYSDYSFNARPGKTTEYYFAWGTSTSPHTVISVKPAITVTPSATSATAGDTIRFSGDVKPALAGRTIYLQLKTNGTWSNVAGVKLDAASHYAVDWTVPSDLSGDQSLRMRLPAGSGLAAGTSPVVVVTVQ